MSDVVSGLLAKLERLEGAANERHTLTCGLVLGSISGNLNDECDCGTPESVLRLCRAHRDLIVMHQPRGGYKSPDNWYGDQNECQTCGGYELEAGFGERGHRSKWPCQTLVILARGYGVEEQADG